MSISQKRNPALDVIRIFALICVIGVHFFAQNEFYVSIIAGKRMYLMTLLRNAFMICVPLFIILSGYLMSKKTLTKKHYWGLEKTISIYLIISIITIIYKAIFLKEVYPLKSIIFQILEFSGAPYSWYIEMYIGLYLMIPFLNILYNNLKTKKQKQALIFTLLILTSLPNIVNVHRHILPNWWARIYPITYYFLGCYLHDFPLKISKKKLALLFFITVILFGSFNFTLSYGQNYINGAWQDWGSLPIVVMTLCAFSFIINLNFKKISETTKIILAKISDLCLGAYLISYIFDQFYYRKLNAYVKEVPLRLNYFILMVAAVLISSLIASWIVNTVYTLIKKFILYKLQKKS